MNRTEKTKGLCKWCNKITILEHEILPFRGGKKYKVCAKCYRDKVL